MHHVGVQQVGPLGAHGLRRPRLRAAARRRARSRDAPPRNAAVVERAVEALGVAARVERENAGVDAALAQRGQERQQVLLGAADALSP